MQQTNVNVARRYIGELWSRGHLQAADELVAPGCAVRDSLVGEYVGIEALTAHVRELRRAFPDLEWTIREILADEGRQLALTWCARGTHRGPLAGFPATGQAIELTGLLLLRIEDGKLVAITVQWDPRDLGRQLASAAASPPWRAPRVARGTTPAIQESALDAQWELQEA